MNIRSLSILILSIFASRFALAQEMTVEKTAVSELPSLLAIYKDLHSHPELSWHEEKTSAFVAKELRATGCEVTENFGKYDNPDVKSYGVIGIMKNGTGPTLLVRTDMDALPVHEEIALPYASNVVTKNDEGKDVPVGHMCGHDAHMSAFIGTARALQRLKEQWAGTIMFVAQPAEETGNGARALLNSGLYNRFGKPDFALGFHDKADLQTGHIGITPGYTYANVDSVDVTVRGIGGHGAYPHKTKDPVVLAAEMINAWQTIASRENNPLDPIMGGEDFSEYSLPDHSIPAIDFHIGAVDPEKIAQFKKEGKELPSLHSSKFAPVPEPTIRIGIVGMTSAVLELMKK